MPDAVGDADAVADARIGGFHDGIACKRRRHKYYGNISSCFFHGIRNRIEDRAAEMLLTPLARCNAANHISAIFYHLGSMESPLFASKSLYYDL